MIGIGVSICQQATQRNPNTIFDFRSGKLPSWMTVSRTSSATFFDELGAIVSTPSNEARFSYDARTGAPHGLLIENTATNLLSHASALVGSGWAEGGTTSTNLSLAALGQFGGVSVATQGPQWARLLHSTQPTVTNGSTYSFTLYYQAGTSGRLRGIFRNSNGNETRFATAIGTTPTVSSAAAGAISINEDIILIDGITRKTNLSFTPSFTGPLSIGVGPDSTVTGETIVLLGAQLELGTPSSFILTNGSASTRAADVAAINGLSGNFDITALYGDDTSETFLAQSVSSGYWPPLSKSTLKSLTLKPA
jgi:hypothetical protein